MNPFHEHVPINDECPETSQPGPTSWVLMVVSEQDCNLPVAQEKSDIVQISFMK